MHVVAANSPLFIRLDVDKSRLVALPDGMHLHGFVDQRAEEVVNLLADPINPYAGTLNYDL